tara:strand:+ start:280 stop:489 length:210 start_codon:yes stop_codon:yes gene_type:complete
VNKTDYSIEMKRVKMSKQLSKVAQHLHLLLSDDEIKEFQFATTQVNSEEELPPKFLKVIKAIRIGKNLT